MRFEYITQTATQPARTWTNKQKVQFQYFNPNGLYAQKKALDDIIWQLVDEGKAKSGAVLAYGSGNSFHADQLRDLNKKQRISDIDYIVLVNGYKFDIEQAENFINEVK